MVEMVEMVGDGCFTYLLDFTCQWSLDEWSLGQWSLDEWSLGCFPSQASPSFDPAR